jgi:predicted metalloprotease with PDZ domain
MNKLYILFALFLSGCACKGVTGVVYNQHGYIRHVFKDSPAEEAGLMPGDIILNPGELKGKVGSTANVRFKRGYVEETIAIKRMCVDDLSHEKW